MKMFIKSSRNGEISYTSYDGMDEETIRRSMTEIGHTDIQLLDEEVYNFAVQALKIQP